MVPWTLLDTAKMPGGSELRLMRRGAEFTIMVGQNELMNSRLGGSEEALARLACASIAGRKGASLLIGGLGMGFTLRAALSELGVGASVTVAELLPAVVRWARGPMAEIFGTCLTDSRVTIRESDVARLIRGARSAYDAILLDVDNGPQGLTRSENDGLYNAGGLRTALTALRSGGVLAVWSSAPDLGFTRRLGEAGFEVEEAPVRARGVRGGARHLIWIARRPPG